MVKPTVDYSLYLVTDSGLNHPSRTLLQSVEDSILGGVTLVQLREKNLDTPAFIDLARKVHAVTKKVLLHSHGFKQNCSMNDVYPPTHHTRLLLEVISIRCTGKCQLPNFGTNGNAGRKRRECRIHQRLGKSTVKHQQAGYRIDKMDRAREMDREENIITILFFQTPAATKKPFSPPPPIVSLTKEEAADKDRKKGLAV
jgi:hypothetical protein